MCVNDYIKIQNLVAVNKLGERVIKAILVLEKLLGKKFFSLPVLSSCVKALDMQCYDLTARPLTFA